jgi:hypothetical protein
VIRRLSSAYTLIYKFVYTFLWFFGFGGAVVVIFFNSQSSQEWWILGLVWILGLLGVVLFCARLKRVRMDVKYLYISNYLREVRVPLSSVTDVRDMNRISLQTVSLKFLPSTPFGSSVTFMPKIRFRNRSEPHPVVKEIEASVKRTKRTTKP